MWLGPLLLLLPLLSCAAAEKSSPSPYGRSILHSKTCPRSCVDAEAEGLEGWSFYHDLASLSVCPEPMLLRYNLYTPIDDPEAHISIRACTLGQASTEDNFLAMTGYVASDAEGETDFGPDSVSRRGLNMTVSPSNATCGAGSPNQAETTARLPAWTGTELESQSPAIEGHMGSHSDIKLAIKELVEYMKRGRNCETRVIFAYVRGTLVGLYSGSLIDQRTTPALLLEKLDDKMQDAASVARMSLEVCGEDRSSSSTIGAVADARGDFAAVQKAMKSWSGGQCNSEAPRRTSEDTTKLKIWSFDVAAPEPQVKARGPRNLSKRATCRSITVEGNDDCAKLASRCGIGGRAFESFNKETKDLCSTLKRGQLVCCSSGSLPDVTPKPDSDGMCATYDVKEEEGCDVVATKHGLKTSDLDDLNKKTWAWDGCKNLNLGQRICVSKGKPPMPASFPDALCGPTKPGSKSPTDGTDMADMNPCPLNVCCNVWGNCGTTSDFCTISKTTTGNPGTSKPGENGCVSSCGQKMVNIDKPPETFRKIAYFEAWNYNRPCLNMHVLDIESSYTHVHFAFGEISPDMQVVIPDDQKEQWDAFVSASNFPKKVLAFGGWAFSNEGPNAGLLREAVSPSKRGPFSDRVVKFAVDNKLSGLDFDWEYPGATDIDGSPPGQEEDGENYYQFLKLVRSKMPKDMSLSIAAPASYWYLRGFPIEKMAKELDYLVYMTYDFHGQWDVGNKWAQPGCESGTCLRSHINATTTFDSLVMITKAGVASHKVVVGVSSYGRSFKMANAACRGPQCTYLGERNESPAKKGRCTGTGGYISDFEINEIIDKGGAIKSWYDKETDSDYLVYDRVEWVAYMSKLTKSRRMRDYRKLNLGGTSDWAVDLQGEGSGGRSGRPVYLDPEVYRSPVAKCVPPCILVFPPSALPSPITIRPGRYTTSLEYGAIGPTTISGKETTAFVTRTTTITVNIPVITVTSMVYSNINITQGQDSTMLWLWPSIKMKPIPVEVSDGQGSTTTRKITLPPWPSVTGGPPDENDDDPDWPGPPGGVDPDPEETDLPPPPNTTPRNLPTWTTWPPRVITPIPEDVKEPKPDVKGFKTPCNLWFFSICLNRDGGPKIGGLRWVLPPGVYPPGPPPRNVINPPGPGWTIKPPLPPWPPITVGYDNKITYSREPNCETDSASYCSTTTVLSQTIVGPSTSTVTSTKSDCETVYGCSLTDWETATLTETGLCPLPTQNSNSKEKRQLIPSRGCPQNAIVYPKNPENVGQIPFILKEYSGLYREIKSSKINYLAFYWVPRLDSVTMGLLNDSDDVEDAYYYEEWNANTGPQSIHHRLQRPASSPGVNISGDDDYLSDDVLLHSSRLDKRAPTTETSPYYHLGHISAVFGKELKSSDSGSYDPSNPGAPYKYNYDDAAGDGQFVYIIHEYGYYQDHPEFTNSRGSFNVISPSINFGPSINRNEALDHGSAVGSMVAGDKLGICKKCGVVFVTSLDDSVDQHLYPRDRVLLQLIDALDHIKHNRREGRVAINMSFGLIEFKVREALIMRMFDLLNRLETEVQAVLVTTAGNTGVSMGEFPGLFGPWRKPRNDPLRGARTLPNMMVAGASNEQGSMWSKSSGGGILRIAAPGAVITVPGSGSSFRTASGTSLAAPLIAGLAAYFRSVPSPWQEQLRNPANVRKMIMLFTRPINVDSSTNKWDRGPIIWNGQVGSKSCLRDYATRRTWDTDNLCPDIDDNLDNEDQNPCRDWETELGSDSDSLGRRQNSGSCPLLPDNGELGKSIDWSSGPDSPKCPSGTCGGELCRGFYCVPNPRGPPPDFRDPKDPRGPTGPNVGGGGGGGGGGEDGFYTGPGCATYTSMTVCNSDGATCTSGNLCVPTKLPCPAFPTVGEPLCPSDHPLCGKTTYVDLCARKTTTPSAAAAAKEAREIVAMAQPTAPPALPSSRLRRHMQELEQPQQPKEQEQQEKQEEQEGKQHNHEEKKETAVEDLGARRRDVAAADDVSINNSTGAITNAKLLGVRQDQNVPWGCGGHETGGCTRYMQCVEEFCFRVEEVSCVQAYMYMDIHPVDSKINLGVYEDGELKCAWSISCKTDKSPGCLYDQAKKNHDCGSGNKIEGWGEGLSSLEYISSKTNGRRYELLFGQVSEDGYLCWIGGLVPALCIDSEWAAGQSECKDSKRLRRRLLEA